jgi:hypothetical protein
VAAELAGSDSPDVDVEGAKLRTDDSAPAVTPAEPEHAVN